MLGRGCPQKCPSARVRSGEATRPRAFAASRFRGGRIYNGTDIREPEGVGCEGSGQQVITLSTADLAP